MPPKANPLPTRRQREVLELLVEGGDNDFIANRLSISSHTVKFHITCLAKKLAPLHGTRTEIVGTAFRRGLVQ